LNAVFAASGDTLQWAIILAAPLGSWDKFGHSAAIATDKKDDREAEPGRHLKKPAKKFPDMEP